MGHPVKRGNKRKRAPSWRYSDVPAPHRDPPDIRAEKDRLISEFLARRLKRAARKA